MNGAIQSWIKRVLMDHPEISGRVLEIGSKDICGSARRWFTTGESQRQPTKRFPEYIGVDRVEGNLVDVVMEARKVTAKFGVRSFDVVVCTSMLEHDDDPFLTMWVIWEVLRQGGWLILTVPGWRGEPPHDYRDYWRFLPDGVRVMVERVGLEVVELVDSEISNDVFCLGRKIK